MRTVSLLLFCAAIGSAATAPRQSPPFSILRPGLPPLSLDSYRGKVVALVFISTTCPHCQDFTRQLVPMAKDYTPRGVQFLECAVDPGAQVAVPGFIQQFQPPFPVGYNNQAAVDAYVQRSIIDTRPFYVPHLVFLDRNGVIQGDYAGESDFVKNIAENTRAELDRLLSVGAKPAKKTANRKR